MTIIRASKNNPCEVAGCTEKPCSKTDNYGSIWMYSCANTHEDVPGFKLINTKDQCGKDCGIFIRTDDYGKDIQDRRFNTKTPKKKKIFEYKKMTRGFQTLLLYRSLNDDHRNDLLRRGLNQEQIDAGNFMSMKPQQFFAGVENVPLFFDGTFGGRQYSMLCPAWNLDGRIHGAQLMTDDPDNKYKWLSGGDTHGSCHIEVDGQQELPLTVLDTGDDDDDIIVYLCEGFLKAYIIHALFGVTVIGASGGQFASSPNQLRNLIDELGADKVVALMDAGSLLNSNVMREWRKTKAIVDETECELFFLDWGQLSDKENGKDPDEISSARFKIAAQSPIPFEQMPVPQKDKVEDNVVEVCVEEVIDTLNTKHLKGTNTFHLSRKNSKPYLGVAPRPSQWVGQRYLVDHTQLPRFLEKATANGFKYIALTSDTGTGKNHTVGLMKPEDLGVKKLHFISNQHRAPSTEALENDWVEMPTRNDGLWNHPYQQTATGQPVKVRERLPGAEKRHSGNCVNYQKVLEQQAAGSGINYCQNKCPFFKDCQKGSQTGTYGYLFESSEAYKNDRVRLHPQGIKLSQVKDKNVVGFMDEAQTMPWTDQMTIDLPRWRMAKRLINQIVPKSHRKYIEVLDRFFAGKLDTGYWGMGIADFFEAFGTFKPLGHFVATADEVESLANYEAAMNDESPRLQFLKPLFKALAGDSPGELTLSFSGNNKPPTITITQRNQQLLELIDAYDAVVLMDATLTPENAALMLGCQPNEILFVSEPQKPQDNVTINQLASCGAMSNNRTPKQEKQATLVRNTFMNKHPKGAVLEHKKYSQEGDLIHFTTGRGSNAAKDADSLLIMGTANTNVNAVLAEYELFIGRYLPTKERKSQRGFNKYYETKQQTEIVQELGRLRAGRRRDRQFDIYFVTNTNLHFLTELGYKYKELNAMDFCPAVATPKEKIWWGIRKLLETKELAGMSIRNLADKLGVNQSTMRDNLEPLKAKLGADGIRGLLDKMVAMWRQNDFTVLEELLAYAIKVKPDTILPLLEYVIWLDKVHFVPVTNLNTYDHREFLKARGIKYDDPLF